MPSIVKCLSDPTPAVRDNAFQTLVEIYRHVGEKVRADLEKRGSKWKFTTIKFLETFWVKWFGFNLLPQTIVVIIKKVSKLCREIK